MKIIFKTVNYLFAFVLLLIFSGCEGSSGGHDYDFGNNDPNVCVAAGDSITAGYGLADPGQQAYPSVLSIMSGKTIYNKGVSGSESDYGVNTVRQNLSQYSPGYLLILYGINDILCYHSVNSILNNLEFMADQAKANKTVPVLATLTPLFEWHAAFQSKVNTLNDQIRWLADYKNIPLADLAAGFDFDSSYIGPDGLHPNKQGQELIAAIFYDEL
jgi:lysophospholipase L1-like esterase